MQAHIQRVEAAVNELHQGRLLILTDDENRENEGDLIFPAENITSDIMNFIIRHSSGVVCLSLPETQLKKLHLPLMLPADQNTSRCTTPFAMSIDARDGITTGISAADRVKTIHAAVHDHAHPDDLAKPGHVFPLQGQPGGVLQRAGHTEGSLDLMKIARLKEAAVIAEVMNPDGSVSRGAELREFAKNNHIMILSIQDIIDYRRTCENLIAESVTTKLPLNRPGEFTITVIQEKFTHKEHTVLINPQWDQDTLPLVRIHSSCLTGDVFGSLRCDCHDQLQYSLDKISAEGGIIIYLNQEGRDIGLFNKIKAYSLQDQGHDTVTANHFLGLPEDNRNYFIAAQILRNLHINHIRLLTNNPRKVADLHKYGIEHIKREKIIMDPNQHNKYYLETKKMKLNHFI